MKLATEELIYPSSDGQTQQGTHNLYLGKEMRSPQELREKGDRQLPSCGLHRKSNHQTFTSSAKLAQRTK